jgi:hypothetical protein
MTNNQLCYLMKASSGSNWIGRDIATSSPQVDIVRDILLAVGGGASTANDNEKLSRTTSSKSPLLLMADGSPSTVILYWHCIRSRIRSRMCQSCKGVRGLGDVRSLGHSATLGAEKCRPRC